MLADNSEMLNQVQHYDEQHPNMQPRDFLKRQSSVKSNSAPIRLGKSRNWRAMTAVFLVLIGCLIVGWLLSTGLSSLLLPSYPEVIAVLPQADDRAQPQSITKLAVIVLHQDAHRTSGQLIQLAQPMILDLNTPDELVRQLNQNTGFLINQVILLPSSKVTASTLRWQILDLAKKDWRRPEQAFDLLKIALLTPSIQEIKVDDSLRWGHDMAERVRPLEMRAENCSIGVSNTVGLAGLGRQYADFLAQQGATVRRVTNDEMALPASQVLVDEASRADCALVLPVLANVLSNQVPITHQSGVTNQHRVSVMILLGSDSAVLGSGD